MSHFNLEHHGVINHLIYKAGLYYLADNNQLGGHLKLLDRVDGLIVQ